MMNNFNRLLENYADITVKIGLNVQKGQDVWISAPIESPDFVRKVVTKAYQAGAKNVTVDWIDETIRRTRFQLAPDETFDHFPKWKAEAYNEMVDHDGAFLFVYAPNPGLFQGVDPGRISRLQKVTAAATKKAFDARSSAQVSWTIVSVPTEGWAAKVFPDLSEDEQVEALWKQIFKIVRADRSDPERAWKDHIRILAEKLAFFNEKRFKKLVYKAPGTDLTIELPEAHLWAGGGLTNARGIDFQPNMPTEEIYTVPLKTGVNGTVTNTRPLNYESSLIDDFSITFRDGRIVAFQAEKGYDMLKKIIETDEGTHYLGELALVPQRSPIAETSLIFYNTLFDENASCHLAIGTCLPFNLRGGRNMSKNELSKAGANVSLNHVDFMIGSDRLDIDGELAGGTTVPLFRKGNWTV